MAPSVTIGAHTAPTGVPPDVTSTCVAKTSGPPRKLTLRSKSSKRQKGCAPSSKTRRQAPRANGGVHLIAPLLRAHRLRGVRLHDPLRATTRHRNREPVFRHHRNLEVHGWEVAERGLTFNAVGISALHNHSSGQSEPRAVEPAVTAC